MIWIGFYRQNKVRQCTFSFPIIFLNEDTFYSTEYLLWVTHAELLIAANRMLSDKKQNEPRGPY